MTTLPATILPRAYANLSPMAKIVLLLDSIPDDPSHPDYAKWQVVDTPALPLPRGDGRGDSHVAPASAGGAGSGSRRRNALAPGNGQGKRHRSRRPAAVTAPGRA